MSEPSTPIPPRYRGTGIGNQRPDLDQHPAVNAPRIPLDTKASYAEKRIAELNEPAERPPIPKALTAELIKALEAIGTPATAAEVADWLDDRFEGVEEREVHKRLSSAACQGRHFERIQDGDTIRFGLLAWSAIDPGEDTDTVTTKPGNELRDIERELLELIGERAWKAATELVLRASEAEAAEAEHEALADAEGWPETIPFPDPPEVGAADAQDEADEAWHQRLPEWPLVTMTVEADRESYATHTDDDAARRRGGIEAQNGRWTVLYVPVAVCKPEPRWSDEDE